MKIHLTVLLILILTSAVFGQTPYPSPVLTQESDDQVIRIDTQLINIPVVASDRDGRNIGGLKKENFTILEDGEQQPIEFFAGENAPMNVAILIDTSESTKSFLKNIKSAANDFVKIIRPEDRAIVLSFDFETKILSDFTSDHKDLHKGIERAEIATVSGSDMQSAIDELLHKYFSRIKGRKAIIILTDGIVGGPISNDELLSTLAESDVMIYPILYKAKQEKLVFPPAYKITLPSGEEFTAADIQERITQQLKKQIEFTNLLAPVTGGRVYESGSGDFKKIFQQIADELKKQYLVGVYLQNADDGNEHDIVVRVNPKNIVIRTKRRIQLKSGK